MMSTAGSSSRLIERRAQREPLQYITGRQEFWGLDFMVTPDVLIPRPETELIVETALAACQDRSRPLTIIDLCTGSGCIAISLAKELPAARIFATDTSAKALAVARENARRHGVSDRIRFLEGDLFGPLEELDLQGQVDIIVSNPPYVPSGDRPALQPEVRDYEPELALFAGPEGTEIHRRIIGTAPRFLKKNGRPHHGDGAGPGGDAQTDDQGNRSYDDPGPERPGGNRAGDCGKKGIGASRSQRCCRSFELRIKS